MQKNNGFALIELLIILTIAAIITLLALGPLNRFYTKYSLIAERDNAGQLFYDSSISSHVYEQVLICPSSDHKTCNNKLQPMLIAFVDVNGNGQKDEDEAVLYSLQSKLNQDKIELNAFTRKNSVLIARPESLSSSNFTKKHGDAVLKMSNTGLVS